MLHELDRKQSQKVYLFVQSPLQNTTTVLKTDVWT